MLSDHYSQRAANGADSLEPIVAVTDERFRSHRANPRAAECGYWVR